MVGIASVDECFISVSDCVVGVCVAEVVVKFKCSIKYISVI